MIKNEELQIIDNVEIKKQHSLEKQYKPAQIKPNLIKNTSRSKSKDSDLQKLKKNPKNSNKLNLAKNYKLMQTPGPGYYQV